MAGLFSRIKNWLQGEELDAVDLNAEFNNIITNFVPDQMDDYSTNAAQMQTTTDPGATGTESLATSLAGELERIRFVIKRIVDKTNWYDAGDTTLSSNPGNLAMYLPFDGQEGQAEGTTGPYRDTITRGSIINALSRITADVVAADFDATNKKFGDYSYITGSGNVLAYPGIYNQRYIGTFSTHFRNLFSNDYIAFNPLLGMEVFLDSSGYLTSRITERTAATEVTKVVKTVAGSSSRASDANFNLVTTKWRCNDHSGASTDLLEMEFNGTEEGTQLTAQDIDINPGDGGVWFFGAKRNDPTWTHFSAMSVTPDNEAASAWGTTGTAGAGSVANGVLTINCTGVQTLVYNRGAAPGVDFNAGFTLDFKMKLDLDAGTFPPSTAAACFISARDTDLNRSFTIGFLPGFLTFGDPVAAYKITVDTGNYHVYRITTTGTPNPTYELYIDGVHRGSFTSSGNDATANDNIEFGDNNAAAGSNIPSLWEYVSYDNASATPPIAVNTATGNLDDIAITNTISSDTTIASLVSSSADNVYGSQAINGITMPPAEYLVGGYGNFTAATFTEEAYLRYWFPADGRTIIRHDGQTGITNQTAGACTVSVAMAIDDHGGSGNNDLYWETVNTNNMDVTGKNAIYLTKESKYSVGLHKCSYYVYEGAMYSQSWH